MAFLTFAASVWDNQLVFLQNKEQKRKEANRRRQHRYSSSHRSDEKEEEDPASKRVSSWRSYLLDRSTANFWRYYVTDSSIRSRRKDRHTDTTTWRQRRKVRLAAKEIQSAVEARLETAAPFLVSCLEKEREEVASSSNSSAALMTQAQMPCMVRREELELRYWLGRGGFCDVWEIEPVDGTRVVLKHLTASLLASSKTSLFASKNDLVQGAIDLRLEALYLSQLSHPNILQLHGVVQPPRGLPFADGHYDGFGLLLEPLSDTLDQRLLYWKRQMKPDLIERSECDQEVFPYLAQALDYASQLADALNYLHERRIVVCDAKPSNVGFAVDDTVKLFDFGLCRELPTSDNSGDPNRLYTLPLGGTPTYLPPEVLLQRKYNCKRDVYSWAMVLYEMVSLTKPFEGMGMAEFYTRVGKGGERPSLDKIPEELHSLLQCAWDVNVEQRWTMKRAKLEVERVREQLGFLAKKKPSRHHRHTSSLSGHHRRKSSMDSLLYGYMVEDDVAFILEDDMKEKKEEPSHSS